MADKRFRLRHETTERGIRAVIVGVGSAGCSMIEGASMPKVAVSTSSADLERSGAEKRVMVSSDHLAGIAQSDPSVVKQMPSIAGQELLDALVGADLAFLMCGLGGVSGSLGAKVLASVAKAKGVPSIVVASTPFSAESSRRRELAERVLNDLLTAGTPCIRFDNDKLSSLAPYMPMSRALATMNAIAQRPVIDLCEVLSDESLAVLRASIGDATLGRFGLGLARGDERVTRAVQEAMRSPWFDFPLEQTTTAIAVYSARDPWDKEADRILSELEECLPRATMLWGSYADTALGQQIRLSLVLWRMR